MDTRWPAEEGSWEVPGLQEKTVEGDQPYRGGQLGMTKPTGGGQLEVIGLAGEQLGIDQGGREKQLRAVRQTGRRQASGWEPAVRDCERDV